ncbi:MAG: hypothetical protein Q8Q17_00750 [bacterium]|nr:hypothetical protein [bacterium]
MNTTKIVAIVFLSLLLLVLGNEIYYFSRKNSVDETRYNKIKAELGQVQTDYDKMRENMDYYLNPGNLEKELKARFNYRTAGEKMFIIVQPTTSTQQ